MILSVAAALSLGACSLNPTPVTRDVRAVWSPDGASVLIVTSEYLTGAPEEPYFAAASGRDWSLILSQADGTAADPLATRQEIDRFPEEVVQGGLPQYEPVYWFPDRDQAVFGGRRAYIRRPLARQTWFVPTARDALQTALGNVSADWHDLSAERIAQDMERLEFVPSPDGRLGAALFASWYLYGDVIGGSTFEYRVIVFYDLDNLTLLRALRASPEIWHTIKALAPYPELSGATQHFSHLAWSADASGVWAYLPEGENPLDPVGVPPVPRTVARAVRWLPLEGDPADAQSLPGRPLPTASGPVSPEGRAWILTESGNATTLSLSPLSGWTPFSDQSLTDLDSWLETSQQFNF